MLRLLWLVEVERVKSNGPPTSPTSMTGLEYQGFVVVVVVGFLQRTSVV